MFKYNLGGQKKTKKPCPAKLSEVIIPIIYEVCEDVLNNLPF